MNPRPVLLVSHQPAFGGAERSLCALLAELDRARFAPRVVTSAPGPLTDACHALDVPVDHVPMVWPGPAAKLRGLPGAARALAAIAERHGAALLHANTLIAGYVGLVAARRAAVPMVWHVRDMQYPWLGRAAALRAAAAIAPSRAAAATLGAGRCRVVHNGVPAAFFAVGTTERTAIRAELGVAEHTPVGVMAGRLDTWKGHAVAIDAFRELARRWPDAELWIAGGVEFAGSSRRLAEHRDALRERARAAGLERQVRFLGARDDVPALLAAADVVLQPSTDAESFGRTAAEAKAAGRAVVGSDLGGLREVIRDGIDGALVPPRDVGALVSAVARWFADPAARARAGAAGREDARQRFSAAAHARGVEAVYADVLAARPAVAARLASV